MKTVFTLWLIALALFIAYMYTHHGFCDQQIAGCH